METKINTKSSNITMVKLLFTLCVICLHYYVPWHINTAFMLGAYIYVDFFFILQGFYIEDVFCHLNKAVSEREYIITRLQRFVPIVSVQTIILLVIEYIFYCESLKDYILKGIKSLFQLSFISILLERNMLNNGTLWFLSAYVIAGCVAIHLIKYHKDSYRFWAVIIAAMIYNYIII